MAEHSGGQTHIRPDPAAVAVLCLRCRRESKITGYRLSDPAVILTFAFAPEARPGRVERALVIVTRLKDPA
jgi:hypothetical protein